MASTIKLKNSTTAGNAPSSLETGEVAINVTDGNLFYGSASTVLQNFVVDELEVKGTVALERLAREQLRHRPLNTEHRAFVGEVGAVVGEASAHLDVDLRSNQTLTHGRVVDRSGAVGPLMVGRPVDACVDHRR